MKTAVVLLPFVTALGFVLGPATAAADRSLFFAMDTALRDGKARSPVDQAALVKELGFDGFAHSGYPSDEFLVAFEKQGLRVYFRFSAWASTV